MTLTHLDNNPHAVFLTGQFNQHAAGDGPPLLLVHGFPLDHRMWSGQRESLSQTCRLIAPDLCGFGQTPAARGDVHTMQEFADDLAGLLDALGVTEPVIFCGLSMGGYIGWQFFARHRARLAGLVICDSRAQADSDEAADNRRRLADTVLTDGTGSLADSMPAKLFAEETVTARPEIIAEIQQQIRDASPQGVAAALRGMAERPDVSKSLAAIDVPTLLIGGEHDAISPPAEMQQIADAIPGAEFVMIPAAGHMAPREQPQAFRSVLEPFLARCR